MPKPVIVDCVRGWLSRPPLSVRRSISLGTAGTAQRLVCKEAICNLFQGIGRQLAYQRNQTETQTSFVSMATKAPVRDNSAAYRLETVGREGTFDGAICDSSQQDMRREQDMSWAVSMIRTKANRDLADSLMARTSRHPVSGTEGLWIWLSNINLSVLSATFHQLDGCMVSVAVSQDPECFKPYC
jgi:hypothetical protein